MTFDYNQLGAEYVAIAARGAPLGLGLLNARAVQTMEIANQLIHSASGGGEPSGPITYLYSAFDKLEGLLLIARRFIADIQFLPSELVAISDSAPAAVTLRSTATLLDFESLVFHAA